MPRHSELLDSTCLRRCVAEASQRAPRLRSALAYLHPSKSTHEHEAYGVLAASQIVHNEITPLLVSYQQAVRVYRELCENLQQACVRGNVATTSLLHMFPDYKAQVVALRAHAVNFEVDMQTAMHVQAIDFWLRYVLAELGASGQSTGLLSDLISAKNIPWLQPPYANLVESFGLVMHETRRQARLARVVRAQLFLAVAMGTHARLGRKSTLRDLDGDIVALILRACTACVAAKPSAPCASDVAMAVRWGIS